MIVVVEEPDDALLVSRSLAALPDYRIEFEHCASAAACTTRLRSEPLPDIVLIDYLLAPGTGTSVIEQINSSMPKPPYCILLTDVGGEAVVAAALRAGARDYLHKSELGPEELGRMLRHYLSRRSQERRFRTSESHWTQLTQYVSGGICVVQDGNIAFANQALADIGGYSVTELTGASLRHFLTEEDYNRIAGLDLSRHPSDIAFSDRHEWLVRARKGDLILSAGFFVTEYLGRPALLIIVRDLTQRRRGEEELRRHRDHLSELVETQVADLRAAKEAAERANLAKNDFLANMSHEIRTPLHGILGFANLGRERCRDPDVSVEKLAHYFQRVRESGENLLNLLNDLLDLSKMESGGMSYDMSALDLNQVIDEVLEGEEGLLSSKGLRVTRKCAAVNSGVLGDRHRLRQVLVNLLSNAIKFSQPQGEIQVIVNQEGTDRVAVEVIDQGIGIPSDEMELVFEKFYQSRATRGGAGGAGMGLAICREIVSAHRGIIEARANPGGGAIVRVSLPVMLAAGVMQADLSRGISSGR